MNPSIHIEKDVLTKSTKYILSIPDSYIIKNTEWIRLKIFWWLVKLSFRQIFNCLDEPTHEL